MPVYTFSSENNNSKKDSVSQDFTPVSDATAENGGILSDLINTAPYLFGFKSFLNRENIMGCEFTVRCLARLSSDSAYIQKCKAFFKTLSVFAPDSFFTLGEVKTAAEYTVFSFHSTGKEIPLKEVKQEKRAEYAKSIFSLLLKLIYSYGNTLKENALNYIPLSCLCEDNIYLCPTENANLVNLKLKVLPAFVNAKDKENLSQKFPLEVWMDSPSVASDIYSAAYLYCSLKGGLDEKDELDRLAEDCLNPDANARPAIEALITKLGDSDGTPVIVSTPDIKEASSDRIIATGIRKKEKGGSVSVGGIWSHIKNLLTTDDNTSSTESKTRTSYIEEDDQ
ncbi:MAG: hypothetical protein U0M42_03225 [Acutalibacteraceae bacterium]|nr:hypothetical protein [Acutalibacteraceae bacterium]